MPLVSLMNAVADIERNIPQTRGPSGFKTDAWTKIHLAAPCRISPHKAERVADFKRLGMSVSHRIHFVPPIDDLREGDRVAINSTYYSVTGAFDPDLVGWFTVVEAQILS